MRRGEKIKVKVYEIKVYENRAATDFFGRYLGALSVSLFISIDLRAVLATMMSFSFCRCYKFS
jgi:hypothetical protein